MPYSTIEAHILDLGPSCFPSLSTRVSKQLIASQLTEIVEIMTCRKYEPHEISNNVTF